MYHNFNKLKMYAKTKNKTVIDYFIVQLVLNMILKQNNIVLK